MILDDDSCASKLATTSSNIICFAESQITYMITVLCLSTWQHMFTATGSPAICVGYVSIFTASAVVSPPSPAGPIPSELIEARSSFSRFATYGIPL